MSEVPIRKAAGIVVRGRRVLVNRGSETEPYVSPGGKVDLESGETEKEAVIRELAEEHGIAVVAEDLVEIGIYEGEAATRPGERVSIAAFLVNKYAGDPRPTGEIIQQKYLTSRVPFWLPVGSIMEHQIMPELRDRDIID